MKVRVLFAVIAMFLTIAVAASLVEGHDKEGDKKKKVRDPADKEKAETDPSIDLATAYSLIEYGRANDSALSLLAAANILRRARVECDVLQVKATTTTEKDPKKEVEINSDAAPSFFDESGKLLAEVKAMSKDPHILALADEIGSVKKRGTPVPGKYFGRTLPPGGSDSFAIACKPTESVSFNLVSTPAQHIQKVNEFARAKNFNVSLAVHRTYQVDQKQVSEAVGSWKARQVQHSFGATPKNATNVKYAFTITNTSSDPAKYQLSSFQWGVGR